MESGIEPSVDLETLDERIKIREMILKGQIQEAIALINSLHPELLDTNRYLYFHLQVGFSCVASGLWTLDKVTCARFRSNKARLHEESIVLVHVGKGFELAIGIRIPEAVPCFRNAVLIIVGC